MQAICLTFLRNENPSFCLNFLAEACKHRGKITLLTNATNSELNEVAVSAQHQTLLNIIIIHRQHLFGHKTAVLAVGALDGGCEVGRLCAIARKEVSDRVGRPTPMIKTKSPNKPTQTTYLQ